MLPVLLIRLRYAGCCDEDLGSKQRLHRFHYFRGAWNLLFACHRNNCPSAETPAPSFSVDVPGLALVRSAPPAAALCFCYGTTDDEAAPHLRQPLHHQRDLRPPQLPSSLSSSASPTAHFKALRVSLAFSLRTVARNLRHRVFYVDGAPLCGLDRSSHAHQGRITLPMCSLFPQLLCV